MYKIYWDNDHALLDSIDSVERLLDRLHESYRTGDPTLVTLERGDNGDSLSIGLGAAITVLNYVRGDQNPPYYTSSSGTDADETISFFFGGEWSEYPLKSAVPISIGRAAIKRFCETGQLLESVVWEEV